MVSQGINVEPSFGSKSKGDILSIEVMNAVWRHSKAQGRQKLVLLAIADHQGENGAYPSIRRLAEMTNASQRSVQRDIQNLVAIGELKVEVQNAPSHGQYKSNLYWVQLAGVTESSSGVTESASGVTDLTSGVTAGGVLTLKEPLKKPKEHMVKEFEEFWKHYPRKVGKSAAAKSFLKAVDEIEVGELLEQVVKFAQDPNLPPQQYIPHASTWLNEGRWNDEPYPERQFSKEELAIRNAAISKQVRDLDREATKRILAEQDEARKQAAPIPKCRHGKSILSCMLCLKL